MECPSALRCLIRSPSPVSILPCQSSPHTLFLKKKTDNSSWFHLGTKLSLPSDSSRISPFRFPPLKATETHVTIEAIPNESECIEIGYISSVHGFRGEVRVKPTTDFPELRFSKPGKRWLKARVAGKESIKEVELIHGRDHPGQKCWILSFSGFDSSEKAMQLVGSALLVRKTDRPKLEEGEFYTPDLVGMKVVLKKTGMPVGTVVDVYSTGPNDLLQVLLSSTTKQHSQSDLADLGTGASGPFAWVPFVEAIVPHVDMIKREMLITPPKGLLELNLHTDVRSKKERRFLEWKERKKLQKRFTASKKKLIEMGQEHILQGFSVANKAQKGLLVNQIARINFKMLQQALQTIDLPYSRSCLSELLGVSWNNLLKNVSRISKGHLIYRKNNEEVDIHDEQYERGLRLFSEGKVAIILVTDGKKDQESVSSARAFTCLHESFIDNKNIKTKQLHTFAPIIIVSPSHELQYYQQLFSDHDYFGFDSGKVQFFEEEKLPVISRSPTEERRYRILVKSPWEIIESPMGSGGVFGLLLQHHILESLNEMGVGYVEVCSSSSLFIGHPLFAGFVDSCEADVGMKVSNDSLEDLDDSNYDMMFSIAFLRKLSNHPKLQFSAVPQITTHVEKVNKEWVEVIAASPNSYHLQCSIYSSLNASPPDKICLLHVTD